MIDVNILRTQPEVLRTALTHRQADASVVDRLLAHDADRRRLIKHSEDLRAKRKQESNNIGARIKAGEDPAVAKEQVRAIGDEIERSEADLAKVVEAFDGLMLELPNIPLASVPVGASAEDNVLVRSVGTPPVFDFEPKAHWDVGEHLGMLNFEQAAAISGARFVVLHGALARLERALVTFMLDVHTREHGYQEVAPPYLVRAHSLQGTGQLPKFSEDLFKVEHDDLWLIPTAEVPVTNLYRDQIVEHDQLPKRFVAYTPCFRREAGAGGRDTRGIIRQHQFDKVELVQMVEPSTSLDALEALTGHAEEILKRLGLPYRTMALCTGDMGFGSAKTYDIEVWSPGQGKYVEISSCSVFTDFQARRMKLRYRADAASKPEFCHTLNGSGLAVGRTMVAILENFQQADGTVRVPEPLRAFMGCDTIIPLHR